MPCIARGRIFGQPDAVAYPGDREKGDLGAVAP